MSDQHARERRRQGRSLPAGLVDPHPTRFDADGSGAARVLDAHRQAVDDGCDGYVDPVSGLFSFTAMYHWQKGACCELGCLHCPWVDADSRMAVLDPTDHQ